MATLRYSYRCIVFTAAVVLLIVASAAVDQLCQEAQAVAPPSKWKKSDRPLTPSPVGEGGETPAAPPASISSPPATDKEYRKALGDIHRQLIDIDKKERDMMDKLSVLEAAGEGEKARGLKADIYDLKERRQALLKQKMDLTAGWFKRATPPPSVPVEPIEAPPALPAAAPAPPAAVPTSTTVAPTAAPEVGSPRLSTIPYAETPPPKITPSAKTPPSTVYPGPAVTPGWKSDLPAGWEKPEELPPGAVPLERVKSPYGAEKRQETPVTPAAPVMPVTPLPPVTPARPAMAPIPAPPASVPEEIEEIGPTEEVEEKVSPPSRWQ